MRRREWIAVLGTIALLAVIGAELWLGGHDRPEDGGFSAIDKPAITAVERAASDAAPRATATGTLERVNPTEADHASLDAPIVRPANPERTRPSVLRRRVIVRSGSRLFPVRAQISADLRVTPFYGWGVLPPFLGASIVTFSVLLSDGI